MGRGTAEGNVGSKRMFCYSKIKLGEAKLARKILFKAIAIGEARSHSELSSSEAGVREGS